MKCDISFSLLGGLMFNASDYVVISIYYTLRNRHIEDLNEFHQKHFELVMIHQCAYGASSFNGTVTNLYLLPEDQNRTDNIMSTLNCFPRVRHLHIELSFYTGLEETFTCEMFENLESITINTLSHDVVEFIPKINRFMNSKTAKRLVPFDCVEIEEIAWNLGWELLPPRRLAVDMIHIESSLKQSYKRIL